MGESVRQWLLRFRVVRWFRNSSAYQIFVVRARRRRTSLVWYWVSAIFLMCAAIWGVAFSNPILELDEMEVREGLVTRVIQRVRTECGDKVYLQTDEEDELEYTACLFRAEGKSIEGQHVKVWSQRMRSVFGMDNHIYQIKLGGLLINDYAKTRPNRRKAKKSAPTVVVTFLVLGFLPLLRVWWVNRKPLVPEGNDLNR